MIRVLVTGCNGFLGSNIVRYLLNYTDFHVTGVDISLDEISDDRLELYQIDITNFKQNRLLFSKTYDIIFHTAGFSEASLPTNDPSISVPLKAIHVNTYGTAIMCDLAKQCKAKLIYPMILIDKYNNYATPFETSKKLGEDILRMYYRNYGGQCICVHMHNLYGPNNYTTGEFSTIVSRAINDYKNNSPLKITGKSKLIEYTHVEDAVRCLVLLAKHPNISHCPTVKICSGQYYSERDILLMIHPNPMNGRDYVNIHNDYIGDDVLVHEDKPTGSLIIKPGSVNGLVEWVPVHSLEEYIRSVTLD